MTAADFETEQARQDLILEIVRTYYGVLVLKENVKAADEALKTAEASAQRMETMHKAGLLVDSDLLSAKVFVSQMKDRQIRAQNDLALAEMQLAREMGMAVDAPAEPAATLAEPGMPAKILKNGCELRWSKDLGFARPNCRRLRWAMKQKQPKRNSDRRSGFSEAQSVTR